MPGTPMGMGMDHRGASTMDLATAMDHSRLGLEGGDYFLGAPRFPPGTLRPRSPMVPIPSHDWDHDRGYSASGSMSNALGFRERDRERDLEECIRKYAITLRYITQLQAGLQTCRDNRVAALLNGAILAPGRYAQVYPLRCDDGTYPTDFKSSKTVAAMRVLDISMIDQSPADSQLDRIMQAYRLPLDLSFLNANGHQARDSTSSSRVRQAKLHNLLEFVGAYNLLEIGIICIFLCLALGIANIFNPPIIILFSILCLVSGLILIFVEVPLLLRICPTSEKFDVFIRRFTTNYMRAGMYTLMSLIQWLSLIRKTTSLVAAAVLLLAAAICYLIAGLKGQGFVGSKTLGGQGVAQMIV
ncbi:MAG: hypothetical protein LQ341_000469 [Variospora aurantia]|nr:MAG: hypothetical protein LQ341_000469 [Variospora aurantia]